MSLGTSSRSNSRATRRKASKHAKRSASSSSSASDHAAVEIFMDTAEAKAIEDSFRNCVGDYPEEVDMEAVYWAMAWRAVTHA
ncbi:hypothetical protein FA13DRAFT_1800562 [Coprinellus micaceus]|uniref:Uncharacterized protein n=1 Tax=Coprinellus micaceus TaxID=71717 RepID=A0A4Y7SG71_COPMI|nr:hypothetical protein FA13DRAFT_1800562 [Coprinellus micaceus]